MTLGFKGGRPVVDRNAEGLFRSGRVLCRRHGFGEDVAFSKQEQTQHVS